MKIFAAFMLFRSPLAPTTEQYEHKSSMLSPAKSRELLMYVWLCLNNLAFSLSAGTKWNNKKNTRFEWIFLHWTLHTQNARKLMHKMDTTESRGHDDEIILCTFFCQDSIFTWCDTRQLTKKYNSLKIGKSQHNLHCFFQIFTVCCCVCTRVFVCLFYQ